MCVYVSERVLLEETASMKDREREEEREKAKGRDYIITQLNVCESACDDVRGEYGGREVKGRCRSDVRSQSLHRVHDWNGDRVRKFTACVCPPLLECLPLMSVCALKQKQGLELTGTQSNVK